MARIGFLGLGNMGLPMAKNLLKAGHEVRGFDVVPAALGQAAKDGISAVGSIAEAVKDAEVVVSMLPAGHHVRSAYESSEGVIASAPKASLFIDSSTIDVASARAVAAAAKAAGQAMIDAPVSGGVGGAAAGTLTFMCGGPEDAFVRARPILEGMGKNIFHAGDSGTGQAAKICNNMILAISMIGVSEAFVLAEKLGLDHQKLFDIAKTASGQCWSLTSYCPVPGPVPTSPANRDYQAGFTAAMMLKDLRLAQGAAAETGAATPLGAEATSLYQLMSAAGRGGMDFSGIIKMLRGEL